MNNIEMVILLVLSFLITVCANQQTEAQKEVVNTVSIGEAQSAEENKQNETFMDIQPLNGIDTKQLTLNGEEKTATFLPFLYQPLGLYVPDGYNQLYPDAKIGSKDLDEISVFILPKNIEKDLEEFMLSHTNTDELLQDQVFTKYSDYKGTVIRGSGRYEKRIDFFVTPYQGRNIFMRIATPVKNPIAQKLYWEIARHVRVTNGFEENSTNVISLISNDYSHMDKIELNISGKTQIANFVPFSLTNYGLFVPPSFEVFQFHDGTEVGLSNAEIISSIEPDDASVKSIFESFVNLGTVPLTFDANLQIYEEYYGTKIDFNGIREDFFLYRNRSEVAVIRLRYFEENKDEIQPILIKVTSTITPYKK